MAETDDVGPRTILWRRLDAPGHDACRLAEGAAGWSLAGATVFRHETTPVWLAYRVECDRTWRTQHARVEGWLGTRRVELDVARSGEGAWILNTEAVPGLATCVDLDLAFTPATNLLPLRRLALAEGQSVDVPAARLDPWSATLELLPQRYERRGPTTYWYEAAAFDYAALLEVAESGFVRHYPELWAAEE